MEIAELLSKLDHIKDKKKSDVIELRKSNEFLITKNEEYKAQLESLISKLGSSEDLMKLFEDNLAAVKSIISTLGLKSEKIAEEGCLFF
jgi:hypothetical protein